FGGYGHILRDARFMSFVASFTLTQICAALIWVLLSVYTKVNFGLPERLYGWLPTTNAIMVVLFQLWVTQRTKWRPPLRMMAVGSLLYALGVGSIALGRGFSGFWLSMVVLTVGELILVPTATTYAANLAPADMRGRYMSIYGLTWGLASGIGPIFGGLLNDHLGPAFIWYGGFVVGLIAMVSFMVLAPRFPANLPTEVEAAGD
ncbi:MAG TPA: MFS transporter, partial [Anaerolineales bacterium]